MLGAASTENSILFKVLGEIFRFTECHSKTPEPCNLKLNPRVNFELQGSRVFNRQCIIVKLYLDNNFTFDQDRPAEWSIGLVLNEQGTGYEHIFFLVRTFNID